MFDRRRNPFFGYADMDLFLAYEGDRIVGRVAAIDDHRHNEVHQDNLAAFGFFEADREEVAAALLAAVERWAVARGRTAVRGPLNPSLNHSGGLQIDAFDTDPYLMMPCNPPEYAGWIEAAGYRKVKDLWCWLVQIAAAPEQKVARIAAHVQRRHGITVRSMNLRRIRSETDKLYEIYCSAWQSNWGFVAPTREEFGDIVKDLRWVGMTDGLLIAEIDGRPVGCTTIVPDVNQVLKGTNGRVFPALWWRMLNMRRTVTRARAIITGVIREHQNSGVVAVLMYHFLRVSARYGLKEAEFSWILEDNAAANDPLERYGAKMYKTYRLYQKPLAEKDSRL